NRMMIWICSQDSRIWDVIEEGNYIPTKKTTQKVDGKDVEKEVPKTKKEYNEDDWKKIAFNFKAINFLHYGLNQDDYMKISTCTTDSPKTFSFLYKRAIPASGPDQVVSLYEWISFPRRSVDQAIFQLTL
ncbi:hypothetical protein PIB30_111884, partial [Stylosanthes scabra]|nr:hypothetical protein [Stylosanthes scabra]